MFKFGGIFLFFSVMEVNSGIYWVFLINIDDNIGGVYFIEILV